MLDADARARARAGRDAHRPLRGDRRRRHRAREPGADDARQHDRHLQRARGGGRDEGHARAAHRLLDERGLRHARVQRQRGRTSRRSARSARRAGRTPSRSSRASTWRTPTTTSSACRRVTVRPFNVFGPGQIGGGAIRAFIEAALARRRPHDPRRRLADPRLVLRRRHGRARAALPRASRGGRAELQRRQRRARAVTIFDLAQRIKRLTGCPGEIVFPPLHYVDVELRIPNVEKARELLGFEREGRARRRARAGRSRGIARADRR